MNTETAKAKLAEIRATGDNGMVVRDLTRFLRDAQRAGLITIEQNAPIKRAGAPGWNYLVKAV